MRSPSKWPNGPQERLCLWVELRKPAFPQKQEEIGLEFYHTQIKENGRFQTLTLDWTIMWNVLAFFPLQLRSPSFVCSFKNVWKIYYLYFDYLCKYSIKNFKSQIIVNFCTHTSPSLGKNIKCSLLDLWFSFTDKPVMCCYGEIITKMLLNLFTKFILILHSN